MTIMANHSGSKPSFGYDRRLRMGTMTKMIPIQVDKRPENEADHHDQREYGPLPSG
jgi:hypothetical protein